ncbi:hypothetical protein CB1_000331043 [Camelus ferus]|nr:hypothetical protein CB1_000331043 [Camelus ferus]
MAPGCGAETFTVRTWDFHFSHGIGKSGERGALVSPPKLLPTWKKGGSLSPKRCPGDKAEPPATQPAARTSPRSPRQGGAADTDSGRAEAGRKGGAQLGPGERPTGASEGVTTGGRRTSALDTGDGDKRNQLSPARAALHLHKGAAMRGRQCSPPGAVAGLTRLLPNQPAAREDPRLRPEEEKTVFPRVGIVPGLVWGDGAQKGRQESRALERGDGADLKGEVPPQAWKTRTKSVSAATGLSPPSPLWEKGAQGARTGERQAVEVCSAALITMALLSGPRFPAEPAAEVWEEHLEEKALSLDERPPVGWRGDTPTPCLRRHHISDVSSIFMPSPETEETCL